MALIKCNECGKEISDQAKMCPNCGFNLKYLKKEAESNSPEGSKRKNILRIVLCICAALILIIGLFLIVDNSIRNRAALYENATEQVTKAINGK